MLVDVATFIDSPITTSPREILAVRRSGESASDSFAWWRGDGTTVSNAASYWDGSKPVECRWLTNTNQINIMILNEVKTAMNSLPETIMNINSKGDDKDSKRVKSELIEYAIETLLQSYLETHENEDGREILKAKLLLHELSKEL
jgi:hypothetical protein